MSDLLKSMAERDRPAYLTLGEIPMGVTTKRTELAVQMTTERAADRERATILAALRFWARHEGHSNRVGSYEEQIATQDGRWPALDAEQIELLCERIGLDTAIVEG